ncbi:MAG: ATP-grasp domain-containing protein [Enterocloster citroniae]|nr:ATP-grasp domain-containing protein [Enterocloster citroniae]
MKILFTSVGRRVELIQAFRCAAEKLKVDLIIIGTDITEDAPALYFCDKTQIVCRIKDKQYIPMLLKFCKEEKVDCLIPTIDTDLLVLAGNKEQFEAIGTKVLVSAADKVKLCRDKNYTADYFISLGLKSPLPFSDVVKYEAAFEAGKQHFPAFIKPKDGSSSMNAYRVDNLEDLKLYAEKIEDYIIQPFISGREYTIDVFCDYYGNPVYITPRERLAVRAGEVLKTKIIQDDTMIDEILMLIKDFKPCGQITVQLIRDEDTGEDYYIEINPRFGGGAPLSMKAGADSAGAVIKMLTGGRTEYVEKAARDGEIYSRFDQSICVKKGKSRIGNR